MTAQELVAKQNRQIAEIKELLYLYRGDNEYDELVDYARRKHAYLNLPVPFDEILAEAMAL
jgi:hypothetical protein